MFVIYMLFDLSPQGMITEKGWLLQQLALFYFKELMNKQELIDKIESMIEEENCYIEDTVSGWDVPKAETARETLIEVLKLVRELE